MIKRDMQRLILKVNLYRRSDMQMFVPHIIREPVCYEPVDDDSDSPVGNIGSTVPDVKTL